MWPSRYYVAGMDRVRQELRRPAVWLIPLVVLAIQLVGSIGPRHRAGDALHWAPLNWFGYLLLVAGPVVLLMRTVYPYAVLLTVLAITVVYTVGRFRLRPDLRLTDHRVPDRGGGRVAVAYVSAAGAGVGGRGVAGSADPR